MHCANWPTGKLSGFTLHPGLLLAPTPAPQRHNNVFSLEIRGFYRLIKLFSSVIFLGFAGKTIDKLYLFVYIFITRIQQLLTFHLFFIATFLPPNESVVITYPPSPTNPPVTHHPSPPATGSHSPVLQHTPPAHTRPHHLRSTAAPHSRTPARHSCNACPPLMQRLSSNLPMPMQKVAPNHHDSVRPTTPHATNNANPRTPAGRDKPPLRAV